MTLVRANMHNSFEVYHNHTRSACEPLSPTAPGEDVSDTAVDKLSFVENL